MNPLVSAIMPTRGRQAFARWAVECFLAQTYPHTELVILDDLNDRSFPRGTEDLPHGKARIIYLMHTTRSIPDKRNLCIQLAKGDTIAHFDSDDWSAPERLMDQVQRLDASAKQVTGYHSILFHDAAAGYWAKYCNDAHYAVGTSLCYRKAWAVAHPFRSVAGLPNVGEDNDFKERARQHGELISVDGGALMVARVHDDNTNPTRSHLKNTYSYRPVTVTPPEGYLA